jgi:hypothetical protein
MMQRRGVTLVDNPQLHAKVYVFPRAAIIGSTNVSRRSFFHLREAGVLLTNPTLVRQAREFVESMADGIEVDAAVIERFPQREPKGFSLAGVTEPKSRGNRRSTSASGKSLFVASAVYTDFEPEIERLAERATAEARQRATRKVNFEEYYSPSDPGVRVGDEIIVRVDDESARGVHIEPPGVVFAVKRSRAGGVVVIYALAPGQNRRSRERFAKAVPLDAAKWLLKPQQTFRRVPESIRQALLAPFRPWKAPLRAAKPK